LADRALVLVRASSSVNITLRDMFGVLVRRDLIKKMKVANKRVTKKLFCFVSGYRGAWLHLISLFAAFALNLVDGESH
jgi:hypothetical protein